MLLPLDMAIPCNSWFPLQLKQVGSHPQARLAEVQVAMSQEVGGRGRTEGNRGATQYHVGLCTMNQWAIPKLLQLLLRGSAPCRPPQRLGMDDFVAPTACS
jgi:hypothetical protein